MTRSTANGIKSPILAAGIALLLWSGWAAAQGPQEFPRSVSVQGEAERRVAPDMATLHMEVVTESKNAAEGRREADAVTQRALDALREAGVDDADIDTTGLSISPQFRWLKEQREQQLTGFRISRSIDVRVMDLERLGDILETLSDTGVNSISPPQLGLKDKETLHREVLAAAAKNARERAAVIAAALDAELGPVITASAETPYSPMPMRQERAMMMAVDAGASTSGESYSAGNMAYRATVHTTFSLK